MDDYPGDDATGHHRVSALRSLPHVDRVAVEERAAALGKRSIKTDAKRQGIRLAISLLDLTTLEGQDTPGKVRQLAAKAVTPSSEYPEVPSCAAVCVYPSLVPVASDAVSGPGVRVASVATGFPAGQTPLATRLEETRCAVADGAHEIDMVISREAFLSGDDTRVSTEIALVKDACGEAHLKVILETAELGSYEYLEKSARRVEEGLVDLVTMEYLVETNACVAGDPDRAIEMFKAYEATGCDVVFCLMNPYSIGHEDVMQTIELMGKHVIPAFS